VLTELNDLSARSQAGELEHRGIQTARDGKWSAGKIMAVRRRLGLSEAK